MELLFELIFGIITECTLEASIGAVESKKVHWSLRLIAALILIAVCGGFLTLFVFGTVLCVQDGQIFGAVVVALIGIGFLAAIVYIMYEKYRKIKNTPNVDESVTQQIPGAELWDAYTADGKATDKVLVRGNPIPNGLYHMVCEILITHKDGDFLCMKRASTKPNYPGFYEATAGGSALKGEDKWQCVKRELREETGLTCNNITEIACNINEAENGIFYSFVGTVDCDKSSVKLQQGETEEYEWLTKDEFIDFINSDKIIDVQKKRFLSYYEKMGYIK